MGLFLNIVDPLKISLFGGVNGLFNTSKSWATGSSVSTEVHCRNEYRFDESLILENATLT